jgi:ADP-heptose:LPS heptosyltransferase
MPELNPKKYILDELRGKLPEKFIVIQLRASTGNRMMRVEKWRNIIPQIVELGYDIVFVDSPEFFNLYENEVINYFPHLKDNIWNLCKTTKSLKHSITIMSQAEAIIAVDSALIHIGASLKKPLVGVYAPFTPEVRLSYYDNCDWVTPKNVKCELFPCFFHQDELMMGHCDYVRFQSFPDCSEKIDEYEIVDKLKKVVGLKDAS